MLIFLRWSLATVPQTQPQTQNRIMSITSLKALTLSPGKNEFSDMLEVAIDQNDVATVAMVLGNFPHRCDPSLGVVGCVHVHPTPISPISLMNALLWAVERGASSGIIELLLNDGRVDPSLFLNQALVGSLRCTLNGVMVVRLLLNDKRVDPFCRDGWAMIKMIVSDMVQDDPSYYGEMIVKMLRDDAVVRFEVSAILLMSLASRGLFDEKSVVPIECEIRIFSMAFGTRFGVWKGNKVIEKLETMYSKLYCA